MRYLSKRTLAKRTLAGLAVSAITLASGASQAGCIPSKPNGWEMPVTMTTLSAGGVTYFTATLYTSPTAGQWGGTGAQLISTHTTCLGNCVTQPFAANSPEQFGMTVHNSTLATTITLLSHGNVQVPFTAKCDTANNILYGFASFFKLNDTVLIFDFGTPFKIPT